MATVVAQYPLDLLARVSSYGGDTTVAYSPSSTSCHRARQMVANCRWGRSLGGFELKVHDGRSIEDASTFGYSCPVWSQLQRTFLGWTDVTAQRPATVNRDAATDVMRYSQTEQCATELQDVEHFDATGKYIGGRDLTAYASQLRGSPPYKCFPIYRNHIENGVKTRRMSIRITTMTNSGT